MKAVLEFAYPEDERKLLYALKSELLYDALFEVRCILAAPYTKAEAHKRISAVVDGVFKNLENQ